MSTPILYYAEAILNPLTCRERFIYKIPAKHLKPGDKFWTQFGKPIEWKNFGLLDDWVATITNKEPKTIKSVKPNCCDLGVTIKWGRVFGSSFTLKADTPVVVACGGDERGNRIYVEHDSSDFRSNVHTVW